MSEATKMVNVKFNETTVLDGGRVYTYGEEGVITESEAKRVGSSVDVLGDATDMFKEAPAPQNKMITKAPTTKGRKAKRN